MKGIILKANRNLKQETLEDVHEYIKRCLKQDGFCIVGADFDVIEFDLPYIEIRSADERRRDEKI